MKWSKHSLLNVFKKRGGNGTLWFLALRKAGLDWIGSQTGSWNKSQQELIIRSFYLPYLPSESTLSGIFLFLEALPMGFFAGVYIVANHKRAVFLFCLCHMQVAWKYFNNGKKHVNFYHFFLGCYANISMFFQEIKEPPTYLSSKNKKIWDRVDSRVQLVWRLQVMGSWSQVT